MSTDQATEPAVQRVNVTEMYDVRRWADRFGCTTQDLKTAIGVVGNVADDVRKYLINPKPATDHRAALKAAFQEPRDRKEAAPDSN